MGLWNGIGNGIGRKKSGINWSSYWSTLISATVENAAPTHVVLTFPTAQTSLGATDFTIAGFTISSASWTGAVFTLVLSEAVIVFDGDLTITFVKSGETATVTNNVADDGNTEAWFDYTALSTITMDESLKVSKWADRLGSGHDLKQAPGTAQPTWRSDGVLFPGTAALEKMKTDAFTLNQPTTVYIIVNQLTSVNSRGLFDGNALFGGMLSQLDTPSIRAFAGAYTTAVPITNNQFDVIRVIFNGNSSSIRYNDNAAVVAPAGANNMGGFTLGSTGGTGVSKIIVKQVIIRKTVDAEAIDTAINNSFKKKVA